MSRSGLPVQETRTVPGISQNGLRCAKPLGRSLRAAVVLAIVLAGLAEGQTAPEPAAQPPAAPGGRPGTEKVLPLREAVAELSGGLAALAEPGSRCLIGPASRDSLLEGYVAHLLAAHLTRRGIDAARSEGMPPSAQFKPDESPSKCLLQELGALGASLFVQVSANVQERRLLVRTYDVSGGVELNSMAATFYLPAELKGLISGRQTQMEDADRRWLRLFEELFAAESTEETASEQYVRLAEGEYFMQVGLWQEAASSLLAASAPGPTRCLMQGVLCLQLAGEWEEAGAKVRALLRQWQYADNGPLYALNTWLHLRQNRPDDALFLLDEGRIWDMARPGLYRYARGLIALEQSDEATAEKELVAAAQMLPDRLFAQLEAARLYWNKTELDEAIRYYREATRTKESTADTWAELAVALRAADDLEGAIAALRRAFRMRNDSLLITRHLASLLNRTGRHEEALDVLRRAAQANPCRPGLLAAYGDGAAEMWRIEMAEKAFRESVQADSQFAYGKVRLAAVLALQRRYREAQVLLTDLLAQRPDYSLARTELGRIRGDLGHTAEALSVLEEAAKNREYDADAHLAMAEIHLHAGEPDKAIRNAQIAVGSRPDADSYAALAETFRAAGEPAKAELAALEATEKDPRSAVARLALARSLGANGKTDGAAAQLAKALEVCPYSVEALEFSGALHLADGDYRGCAELWDRALKLNPWNADLHHKMAELLRQKLRERSRAEEHYTTCLKLEEMRDSAAR